MLRIEDGTDLLEHASINEQDIEVLVPLEVISKFDHLFLQSRGHTFFFEGCT